MQVGFVYGYSHRNAKCVNYNMLLAPFDFLVPINSSI